MSPIHKSITKWFDNISKRTVQMNYKNASKKLDAFEDLVKYYRDKLPIDKQRILDQKLKEAKNAREYFSHSRTMERLNTQETLMTNLESDLKPRYKQYANDLLHGNGNRMKLIKSEISYTRLYTCSYPSSCCPCWRHAERKAHKQKNNATR